MNNLTWHIAGVGAMGGLLAGHFSESGQAVHLILKSAEQLAVYQSTQLTVNHIACHPHAIDIEHLGDEPIDHLICTVKSYDITRLLLRLNQNLTDKSIIILIHNGLGVLDEIKTQLPHLRIICGVSTLGAYREQPFSIKAFLEGKIYLGKSLGEFSPEEINTICMAFQKASVPFEWDETIPHRMLEKFAINCSINLLTALFACKNGELRQHDEVLKQLTYEVAEVLNAYGLQMTGNALLKKVVEIIRITSDNYSSMYKDVQHHKPTELPYLNEYCVKLAAQQKIPTPLMNALLKQVRAGLKHVCDKNSQ